MRKDARYTSQWRMASARTGRRASRVIAAAFRARNRILAMLFTNALRTLGNIVFRLGTSPMGVISDLKIVNLKIQAYSPWWQFYRNVQMFNTHHANSICTRARQRGSNGRELCCVYNGIWGFRTNGSYVDWNNFRQALVLPHPPDECALFATEQKWNTQNTCFYKKAVRAVVKSFWYCSIWLWEWPPSIQCMIICIRSDSTS